MRMFGWLRPKALPEIKIIQERIVEKERALEATEEVVKVAVQNTDIDLHHVQATIARAKRRLDYEAEMLADLEKGLRRK